MTEIHRQVVVVGLDASTEGLSALRWALREAVDRDAAVEVVHCWQPQTLTDLALGSPHELSRASICMVDSEVRAALAEMTSAPEVMQTSIHGRTATTLLHRAAHADLLVLGAHGRTSVHDRVFGKVAETCVKHASCPVVIVDAAANASTYEGRRVPAAAS